MPIKDRTHLNTLGANHIKYSCGQSYVGETDRLFTPESKNT